jgi:hypothetical protein
VFLEENMSNESTSVTEAPICLELVRSATDEDREVPCRRFSSLNLVGIDDEVGLPERLASH